MTIIRKILGALILFLDRAFAPKPVERSVEKQATLDSLTREMVLYQLKACPFCVKVRRHVKRLGIKLEYRNIENEQNLRELLDGGKQDQVPCLRFSENGAMHWMYESSAINAHLSKIAARIA